MKTDGLDHKEIVLVVGNSLDYLGLIKTIQEQHEGKPILCIDPKGEDTSCTYQSTGDIQVMDTTIGEVAKYLQSRPHINVGTMRHANHDRATVILAIRALNEFENLLEFIVEEAIQSSRGMDYFPRCERVIPGEPCTPKDYGRFLSHGNKNY